MRNESGRTVARCELRRVERDIQDVTRQRARLVTRRRAIERRRVHPSRQAVKWDILWRYFEDQTGLEETLLSLERRRNDLMDDLHRRGRAMA